MVLRWYSPLSKAYKTYKFHKAKVCGFVWSCTSTTLFKYWKGIGPSYLNNIYIPSVNNYNTKSQMALNLWLFRTNEGQKNMSLLGPVTWNKLVLSIKTAAASTSFTHGLKKQILEELR